MVTGTSLYPEAAYCGFRRRFQGQKKLHISHGPLHRPLVVTWNPPVKVGTTAARRFVTHPIRGFAHWQT